MTDPSILGELATPLDSTYKRISMIYVLFAWSLVTTSLYIFARSSLRSDSPEVRIKAKFNFLADTLQVIGTFADAFTTLTLPTLVIFRIFILSVAIFLYIGWIVSESIKKIFLKNQ